MTDASPPRLSIVLPAFNEEARLPATLEAIRSGLPEPEDCELIVVDNGSDDRTADVAREIGARFPSLRLVQLQQRGKGRAVQAGMLAASGRLRVFGDADMSWSMAALLDMASCLDGGWDVVVGSREGQGARRVGEPWMRHCMGRVFNRVVQVSAVPGIEDTQCGLKAFSADAAEAIFARQTIMGFGFDVEVLYLARHLGYAVKEVPLLWEHKQASRVQPVRDTLSMLGDVATVRWNAWRGRYGQARSTAKRMTGMESR